MKHLMDSNARERVHLEARVFVEIVALDRVQIWFPPGWIAHYNLLAVVVLIFVGVGVILGVGA